MDTASELSGWPHAEHSRFVNVRPHLWHVQEMGQGETILLLHGASGSTHSWRDLMTELADEFHVVAVDLPGHGKTKLGSRHRSSLPLMAEDLQSLIDAERWHVKAVVAHSAGAALGLRLLQKTETNTPLLAINPALTPFKGMAGVLFPIAARVIAMSPFIINMIKRRMSGPGKVISLMETTGSRISPEGLNLYARLFRSKDHVDGTLLMMAQWKLDGLLADLPDIYVPCRFLVGEKDKAVAPTSVKDIARTMPNATVVSFDAYGHLLHEEAPKEVASQLRTALRK